MKIETSPIGNQALPNNNCETHSSESDSTLYLSLGSNLGDREDNLKKAITLIDERVGKVTDFSGAFVTTPVGFDSDNDFLNAVIAVQTFLPAEQILQITQEIEQQLGRTQKSSNGIFHDRIIDIDLLLYGNQYLQTEQLSLPHAQLQTRRFVLEPLHKIAPQLMHPTLGKSVSELLKELNKAHIRQAQINDLNNQLLDDINRLLPQLWNEAPVMTQERLQTMLNSPNIRLYLLYDEQQHVSGMATLAIDNLATGTKAWVEDVVVETTCRKRGYGRQLLEHLITEARTLQVISLNLTSRPLRKAANLMYQSMGFVKRDTNVYKMTF